MSTLSWREIQAEKFEFLHNRVYCPMLWLLRWKVRIITAHNRKSFQYQDSICTTKCSFNCFSYSKKCDSTKKAIIQRANIWDKVAEIGKIKIKVVYRWFSWSSHAKCDKVKYRIRPTMNEQPRKMTNDIRNMLALEMNASHPHDNSNWFLCK